MQKIATLFLVATALAAQTHTTRQRQASRLSTDQLGLTCTQILDMTSTEWVAKFAVEKGPDPVETIRAVAVYGKCYDARTDQLAARLRKTGKGPLIGARGNFQSVERALKAFASKALLESGPPADAVKSAYASLYEKQFRYEFYESYEPKPSPPAAAQASSPAAKQASPPITTASNAAAPGNTPSTQEPAGSTSQANASAKSKDKDVDPLTAAKNHFGALLGDLPDEQMHDLHKAFGEILGPNSATPRMQLLIYRYAIFLLEPSTNTPFSSPPF